MRFFLLGPSGFLGRHIHTRLSRPPRAALVTAGRSPAEDAATHPTTAYGATKLEATHHLLAARARGLDVVVLRVFNAVGPGAPPTTLPGRLASEMHRSHHIQLGPLSGWRDFVDARDVA